jgi:flagellar protein FlgJ
MDLALTPSMLAGHGARGLSDRSGMTATGTAEAARKTAEDFESMFLGIMFDQMWTDVSADGLFGGGPGEEIFRSLLNQEYAKAISKAGGIGISDAVHAQILRLQEVSAQ